MFVGQGKIDGEWPKGSNSLGFWKTTVAQWLPAILDGTIINIKPFKEGEVPEHPNTSPTKLGKERAEAKKSKPMTLPELREWALTPDAPEGQAKDQYYAPWQALSPKGGWGIGEAGKSAAQPACPPKFLEAHAATE